MIIETTDSSIIEKFKKIAKKEGLVFCKNTKYYVYLNEKNEVLGFAGVMLHGGKGIKARLKNAYVLPDYRGQGIFSILHEYRMKRLKELGVKTVEANVTPIIIQFHLKRGAKLVKKYKSCFKVVYENI